MGRSAAAVKAQNARYYAKNKARINARNKEYAERNKVALVIAKRAYTTRTKTERSAYKKKWAALNPDKIRASKKKTSITRRDKISDYGKAWKKRPEVRARLNAAEKARRANDPQFALRQSMRCRIRGALSAQNTYKVSKTEALIGCTIAELKSHIESLFVEGMSWSNRSDWHIDHRIPCARFDLTDPEQQRRCFHFTNLQPLWKLDNLRKGARDWLAAA